MNHLKSEIEIQAVNLAQQWYSIPHDQLPEFPDLLSGYIRCFPEPADQQAFLRETLRIAAELANSPKHAVLSPKSVHALREALMQHLEP